MLKAFFWREKSLEQMSQEEWEALCDRCGRCCLHKLRDDDTNKILYTEVSCFLLDQETCLCSKYSTRHRYVPDCVELTLETLQDIDWLPPTCAYKLLRDGKDLFPWHPLISKNPNSVIQSGISVKGRCISERDATSLENHIVSWPKNLRPSPQKTKKSNNSWFSKKS